MRSSSTRRFAARPACRPTRSRRSRAGPAPRALHSRGSRRPGTRTGRRASAACRVARALVGPAAIAHAVVGRVRRRARSRRRAPPPEPRREHRQRRARPRPRRAAAGDRDRGAADEHVGLEQLAQPAGDVLERADVVARREADDEIGSLAVEPLEDLAGDLADRLERESGAARARRRSGSRDPPPASAPTLRVERDHARGSA